MSEPPPSESQLDDAASDASMSVEPSIKSELSPEIVNALRQLQAGGAPQHSPTPTPTQPNSQESAATKQDPTPPPQSEWDRLRAQLREKPVDADGWLALVEMAEDSGDLEKIKETYEGMLEVYPNTVRTLPSVQIAYLKHFLDDPSHFGQAEALFRRFLLRTTPSVELLKFYLTYIRRVTTGPNAREVIRKCYDFALGHVGQDKDSYEIWQDYINFLKAGETNTTWEEQQKMDAVRKAYQHAVQVPMENVKRLWEEYQDFENGLNRITAKKFISDLTEAHMQARTVFNQLQEHLTVLFPPPPLPKGKRPAIWLPRPPTFNQNDRALVQRWRLYLKWEESNPLEIEEKERTTFLQRVQSVYRKALVRMRYYPEIWFMAYGWTNSIGKTDEAIALLKAGIEANPTSFVLNFAYAEALELQGNFTEVHATYEKLLEVLRKDLEATEARINSANSSNSSIGSQSSQKTETTAMDITPNQTQAQLQVPSPNASFATQAADEKPPKNKELLDKRTDYGIVYIMYMRFGRRAEGLKSARNIFGKARRDRWTPWEVYEAAALMEYHCGNKDVQVASRIFEKGMETFGEEVEFVLRYLGFLISINDENNARALFERVIGTFPPEKARPLWERWARYEYQYGDLAAAQKLEKRMAEVYPNDPPIKRFAERHKYLNIDAIAVRDLGFVLGRQSTRSNGSGTLGRADTIQSLMASQPKETPPAPSSSKRAPSPEHRRREDSRPEYPFKRPRASSPIAPRERDRDWRDGRDGPRRRHGSPAWERERDREAPPRRPFKEDKEEEKGVVIPGVLSWFIGTLPSSSSFDGPVFRTDDLMQVFRNAVIPSSTSVRARSPPATSRPAGGRPPPDYGPYQGPGGGRRGRW